MSLTVELATNHGGLGFTFEMDDGRCFVKSLTKGSTEAAGLAVGDEIVLVNSMPLHGLSFERVTNERFNIAMFPMVLTINKKESFQNRKKQKINRNIIPRPCHQPSQQAQLFSSTKTDHNDVLLNKSRFDATTRTNPFAVYSVAEKWEKAIRMYPNKNFPLKFLKTMDMPKVQDNELCDIGYRFIKQFVNENQRSKLYDSEKQNVSDVSDVDDKDKDDNDSDEENEEGEEEEDLPQMLKNIENYIHEFKAEFTKVSLTKETLKHKYRELSHMKEELTKVCDEEGMTLQNNLATVMQRYHSTIAALNELNRKFNEYTQLTPSHAQNQNTITNFNQQCEKMKGMLAMIEEEKEAASELSHQHESQRNLLMSRYKERIQLMTDICAEHDMKLQKLHSSMSALSKLHASLLPLTQSQIINIY